MRQLRNKVHLFVLDHDLDTDWNNFNDENTELVVNTYRYIVNSEVFSGKDDNSLFDYL